MKSPFAVSIIFLLLFSWSNKCISQSYFTFNNLYNMCLLTTEEDIRDAANSYGYYSDVLEGPYKDNFGNELSFGTIDDMLNMFYKVKLSPGVAAKFENALYDESYFTLNGKDPKTKYYSSFNSRFQIISVKEANYWTFSVSQRSKSDINFTRIEKPNIIKVSSYSNYTTIQLKKGDVVTLKASGEVTLGPFAGTTGPEGIDGYTMYNYVPGFKQGSLLGRIGDGDWFLVGYGQTITCEYSGALQLIVNDNDPSNNSGYFDVEYFINK
ncbi:hypothetical protein [Ferruginibacter albus]|uniref:hypothetical protein n=1 Tax=Ferruginibacter albus TaxID=2875540 RepID=UPI001CC37306|nr:hypothetical protein [Ferruginibacter albus]UAY50976.1 hypothetical protein K9M53_10290 [Ferruginibacter albus]